MIGGAEGDRTPDLMTASAISSTASGYDSYDLLTFVTGCSRQRVHLLLLIQANISRIPLEISSLQDKNPVEFGRKESGRNLDQ